jgi:hypothetical protein
MRFLANENFPRAAVLALRNSGLDVEWVRTTSPGASDRFVLDWAVRERRILLTFDKDFGEFGSLISFAIDLRRDFAAAAHAFAKQSRTVHIGIDCHSRRLGWALFGHRAGPRAHATVALRHKQPATVRLQPAGFGGNTPHPLGFSVIRPLTSVL